MATCKECVHHRICNRIDHEIEYSDKRVKEAEEQLAIKCRFFKNKTDVVPVVRCKDCKHYKKINYDDISQNTCEITTKRQQPYNYCNYGEMGK